MRILHTEASLGWGGQEIRILREMIGMRERGHHLSLAAAPGALLLDRAQQEGFTCYEVPFRWGQFHQAFAALRRIIKAEQIDLLNTHSSLDAWIAGLIGRIHGLKLIRTRHISAPIKSGLNSRVLYRLLAQGVITTCEEVAERIRQQAQIEPSLCRSIPTGIDPASIRLSEGSRAAFRSKWGIAEEDFVVGTVCVLRSWKGITPLIQSAALLRHEPRLKWLIVGSGPHEEQYRNEAKALKLEEQVIFTGHLSPPFDAMASMDAFALLSTANEGVSQASLQAAYLGLPLITTRVGGLPEVCVDDMTGYTVDRLNPEQVARAVTALMEHSPLRERLGRHAKELVEDRYLWKGTLDGVESMYAALR